MSSIARPRDRNLGKWVFFVLVALGMLIVIATDERFLIDHRDPEWSHIAPFKWWLLVHGLAGATAFFLGPLQFSDTIRRERINLHRWIGRIYVGAVAIAAPVALYIGTTFEKANPLLELEQPAQAGGWFLCTAVALFCVLRGNIPAHKLWMMRSYGFCLVFMVSRLPDVYVTHWSDAILSATLWYLAMAALIVPDLILVARDRRRRA